MDLPDDGIHNAAVLYWRIHIGEVVESIKMVVPQPQDITRRAISLKK